MIDQLLILGEYKTIKTLPVVSTESRTVHVEGDMVFVKPVTHTQESIKRALNRWLSTELETYVVPRLHEIAKAMGVEYKSVTFRSQKTRWGSRSSSGAINFNKALIHVPKSVIDYVVIHELAHVKHMDHSYKFWEHVGKFDPHYRTNRRWLRQHEPGIQKIRLWLEG